MIQVAICSHLGQEDRARVCVLVPALDVAEHQCMDDLSTSADGVAHLRRCSDVPCWPRIGPGQLREGSCFSSSLRGHWGNHNGNPSILGWLSLELRSDQWLRHGFHVQSQHRPLFTRKSKLRPGQTSSPSHIRMEMPHRVACWQGCRDGRCARAAVSLRCLLRVLAWINFHAMRKPLSQRRPTRLRLTAPMYSLA